MTIRRPPKSTRAKGSSGRGGSGPTGRNLSVKVKTARGRKLSSTRWLQRQLNDPYVQEAKKRGYRGRAAFKLADIDARFGLLKPGQAIVDLGCAPGGWLQICAERVSEGLLIGLDLQEVEPLPGCILIQGDIHEEAAHKALSEALAGRQADLVLSDMANAATGHAATDHLRVIALIEAAWGFAQPHLKPGGAFVAKVLLGGTEAQLLAHLKQDFEAVRHFKPDASRADSREQYLVAQGFKGCV